VLLTVLWLPGLRFPVVSDTLNYAFLGKNVWEQGAYTLTGMPYTKHLPLHALVSYPLIRTFGVHFGMHLSTLLGGFGVLTATFLLVRRLLRSPALAAATTAAVLAHPGFVLMSMLGSADLLFTTLFLLALYFYVKAEDERRFYLLAGACAGLSCLTRYNGITLFPLFLGYALWKRPRHLRSAWLWGGIAVGPAIFSTWLLRNFLVFGNPLYSGYAGELQQEAPSLVEQFLSNVAYYGNPLHNLFPFFFVFALIGLWRHARTQPFLLLAMLAAWLLSSIWWVQAIRFFFPGYPLLLVFAILGLIDVLHWRSRSLLILPLLITAGIGVQSLSFCLYTYGDCNAWFDRRVGILPKNMGLTPEGFYAWHLARNFINDHAERGALVYYEMPEVSESVFRSDLHVVADRNLCPLYRITQRPEPDAEILYTTAAAPETAVTLQRCQ